MADWRQKAVAAANAGEYDAALDLMTGGVEFCASDLLLKGKCIQLSRGEKGRQPEDAAAAFKSALELDPEFVPAMIELGWIYYSVFDDAPEGKKYFERALEVTRQHAIEAFRGAARCAEDISGSKGRDEVIRLTSGFVSADDIDESVVVQS